MIGTVTRRQARMDRVGVRWRLVVLASTAAASYPAACGDPKGYRVGHVSHAAANRRRGRGSGRDRM